MRQSNAYMAAYMMKRYTRRRLAAIAQLGGRCKCGEKNPAKLEFHHRNPATKSFTICSRLASVSEEKLQAELAKCDLECADCHDEIHEPENIARGARLRRHGISAYNNRRCRCAVCVRAKAKSRK